MLYKWPRLNPVVWRSMTREKLSTHLLKNNVNDNQSVFGWTPLIFAARNNSNTEVIQELIDSGADVHEIDQNGHTAMSHAQGCGNSEVIKVLIRNDTLI